MSRLHINFPFQFDAHGRTATCDDPAYVRQVLELALFTDPGERVNRPDFGSGIRPLVFAPNSPEFAASVAAAVRANLQHWLAPALEVIDVVAEADTSTLRIAVVYRPLGTSEPRTVQLSRPLF
jgi:phage baseplate assembly protein W